MSVESAMPDFDEPTAVSHELDDVSMSLPVDDWAHALQLRTPVRSMPSAVASLSSPMSF